MGENRTASKIDAQDGFATKFNPANDIEKDRSHVRVGMRTSFAR
jgi:hypothetical protein